MFKVYQIFNLDEEAVNKIGAEGLKALDPIGAMKSLVKKLRAKGYDVLENFEMISGIPTSLIVVGEPTSLKDDFYSTAENLGLRWFRSGKAYSETLYGKKGGINP